MTELNSYRWTKFENGIGTVAIVTLNVEPNINSKNEIREHYSGKGFTSQGYIEEVSQYGYESWKIAARKGLEFAFSRVNNFWTVDIIKIEGRAFTDTNPTVVGYTVMRAFFDKINFQPDQGEIGRLEEFVMSSWTKPYQELIPDFSSMKFVEYAIAGKGNSYRGL
ncbi:MAG: hypothetical protein QM781_06155 [Chitinophagaceae bacterium]